MTILLILSWGTLILSSWLLGNAHNKLIELEHSQHHESWKADFSPAAPGKSKNEAGLQILGFGRIYTAFNWLIFEPQWIKHNPTARALRKRMQLSIAIMGFAGIGLVLCTGK